MEPTEDIGHEGPPTDYAARAAFHARATEAVRKKIVRLYGRRSDVSLPQETLDHSVMDWMHERFSKKEGWVTLKPGLRDWMNQHFSFEKSWVERRDKAIEKSGGDIEAATLDTLAVDIAERYMQAFYLRGTVSNIKTKQIPKEKRSYVLDLAPELALLDIMTNHISNYAEAKLCEAGLTPHAAHWLHGEIIHSTISGYRDHGGRHTVVNPMLGSSSHRSPEAMDTRISRLRGYWQDQRDLLQIHHKDFTEARWR